MNYEAAASFFTGTCLSSLCHRLLVGGFLCLECMKRDTHTYIYMYTQTHVHKHVHTHSPVSFSLFHTHTDTHHTQKLHTHTHPHPHTHQGWSENVTSTPAGSPCWCQNATILHRQHSMKLRLCRASLQAISLCNHTWIPATQGMTDTVTALCILQLLSHTISCRSCSSSSIFPCAASQQPLFCQALILSDASLSLQSMRFWFSQMPASHCSQSGSGSVRCQPLNSQCGFGSVRCHTLAAVNVIPHVLSSFLQSKQNDTLIGLMCNQHHC